MFYEMDPVKGFGSVHSEKVSIFECSEKNYDYEKIMIVTKSTIIQWALLIAKVNF